MVGKFSEKEDSSWPILKKDLKKDMTNLEASWRSFVTKSDTMTFENVFLI